MQYIVTVSFTTMNGAYYGGQILDDDFASAEVISDLLNAGYIEEYVHPSEDEVDLSDYVKYNSYATVNKGGTVVAGQGFNVNASGKMSLSTLTAANYATQNDSYPISKGTLENVLAERLAD